MAACGDDVALSTSSAVSGDIAKEAGGLTEEGVAEITECDQESGPPRAPARAISLRVLSEDGANQDEGIVAVGGNTMKMDRGLKRLSSFSTGAAAGISAKARRKARMASKDDARARRVAEAAAARRAAANGTSLTEAENDRSKRLAEAIAARRAAAAMAAKPMMISLGGPDILDDEKVIAQPETAAETPSISPAAPFGEVPDRRSAAWRTKGILLAKEGRATRLAQKIAARRAALRSVRAAAASVPSGFDLDDPPEPSGIHPAMIAEPTGSPLGQEDDLKDALPARERRRLRLQQREEARASRVAEKIAARRLLLEAARAEDERIGAEARKARELKRKSRAEAKAAEEAERARKVAEKVAARRAAAAAEKPEEKHLQMHAEETNEKADETVEQKGEEDKVQGEPQQPSNDKPQELALALPSSVLQAVAVQKKKRKKAKKNVPKVVIDESDHSGSRSRGGRRKRPASSDSDRSRSNGYLALDPEMLQERMLNARLRIQAGSHLQTGGRGGFLPAGMAGMGLEHKAQACVRYLCGDCTNGDLCKFKHPASMQEAHFMVQAFSRSMCKYGDQCGAEKCLFEHPTKPSFNPFDDTPRSGGTTL